jgi:hypothetical protein
MMSGSSSKGRKSAIRDQILLLGSLTVTMQAYIHLLAIRNRARCRGHGAAMHQVASHLRCAVVPDGAFRYSVCPCRLLRPLPLLGFTQADIIAGISVGCMVVPQGMSYANLAGLPSVFGLYGEFRCLTVQLAAAVFNGSKQL